MGYTTGGYSSVVGKITPDKYSLYISSGKLSLSNTALIDDIIPLKCLKVPMKSMERTHML